MAHGGMEFTSPSGRFHITSYGNGWAYEVFCRATGDELWFQDDDAHNLQLETEDFTNEVTLNSIFECLCE